MALIDLLTNPDSYNISYGGTSKYITFRGSTPIPGFHLLNRVEWNIEDENANPTFLIGDRDHKNSVVDGFIRGGLKVWEDRRSIDVERFEQLLLDPEKGLQFLLRQGTLQALNPQHNQRIYNPLSLYAQIAGGGLTNFKRSGLLPLPAGLDLNFNDSVDTSTGIAPGYLQYFVTEEEKGIFQDSANIKGVKRRELTYNTGDPGKPDSKDILETLIGTNPFKKGSSYNVSFGDSYSKVDLVNKVDVFSGGQGEIGEIEELIKDYVEFKFEVYQYSENQNQELYNRIVFRALLENFDDSYSAGHNEFKYNGRGEKFYIYKDFDRKINLKFKIAAQTRHEMQPLYRKLNYLAAQTAPNYNNQSGRIRTPYMRLTVGDYFRRVPGVITSVNIAWNKDYPWEIKSHPTEDSDMLVLPHILDVSANFQPIHDFTPNNRIDSPFIGIDPLLTIFGYSGIYDNNLIPQNPSEAGIVPPANSPNTVENGTSDGNGNGNGGDIFS